MFIPAGIPDPANDNTSKLVKSGLKNLSFSKSLDHGSFGIIDSAASTSAPNALVRSRLTVAAKPDTVINKGSDIHAGTELTLPFASHAMGVSVGLHKTNVRLYHRALVSDPESLAALERLQGAFFEGFCVS